jgi:hypothetical protein
MPSLPTQISSQENDDDENRDDEDDNVEPADMAQTRVQFDVDPL